MSACLNSVILFYSYTIMQHAKKRGLIYLTHGNFLCESLQSKEISFRHELTAYIIASYSLPLVVHTFHFLDVNRFICVRARNERVIYNALIIIFKNGN